MVVLIGKDWQSRALLRAQLMEDGVDVEAYETARAAFESMGEVLPALLVADLSASADPAAEIDLLAQWADQMPIWIIAGRSLIAEKNLKGRRFELILFRPVDVGELVEQIKQRVEKS
jgi:DNA-binding NtrC family response regulator